jgi:hypothetical protein
MVSASPLCSSFSRAYWRTGSGILCPVGVGAHEIAGDLYGKARLARVPRPGEGEEPRHGERSLYLYHLPLASDEVGSRCGQVVLACARLFFLRVGTSRWRHRKPPCRYLVAQAACGLGRSGADVLLKGVA